MNQSKPQSNPARTIVLVLALILSQLLTFCTLFIHGSTLDSVVDIQKLDGAVIHNLEARIEYLELLTAGASKTKLDEAKEVIQATEKKVKQEASN